MAKRSKSNAGKPTKRGGSTKPAAGADRPAAGADVKSPSVAELRKELDRIDQELLAGANRRAELAQEIGRLKLAQGVSLFDPKREDEILVRVADQNKGPLSDAAVRGMFRELISGARAIQQTPRVAYLGPEFTFSHLAAIERFGQSAELVPVGTIAAVFAEVERGDVEFGVVPMENSTDGRVSDTFECFARSPSRICGELPLHIHHCLFSIGKRDGVRAVYSKPQALSQCRNWLAQHLPQAEGVPTTSTADAADKAKRDAGVAAIASRQVGVNYGLPLLAENIEDNADNVTRFAIIGAAASPRSGNDKTALMMEIAHQPGALAETMHVFKRNRLNMTWIESYPIPGARGRYLFFVEFVGHQEDLLARRAIAALKKKSLRLEVLGSYRQTEPVG